MYSCPLCTLSDFNLTFLGLTFQSERGGGCTTFSCDCGFKSVKISHYTSIVYLYFYDTGFSRSQFLNSLYKK